MSVLPEASAAKSAIRTRIRALRDVTPAGLRAAWSAKICAEAIARPELARAHALHIFLSFGSEVDTEPIVRHALAQGKRVAIPDFPDKGAPMAAAWIDTLDEGAFVRGIWGTRTPRLRRPALPHELDLVFAPLAAFARLPAGIARIGYGKGHYDSFLPALRPGTPVIGLAFALQEVPWLPLEAHDVLLTDVIVA
jgi:5-formyltetrahydrofolate cyclo-ligase